MSKQFFVQVLDIVPLPPVASFSTRYEARDAARTASAHGTGRRVCVYGGSGSLREFYWRGVCSLRYSVVGASGADRGAPPPSLAHTVGEAFATWALGGTAAPVGDTGAPAAIAPESMLPVSMLSAPAGEGGALDTRAFAAFLADYIADTLDQGSDHLAGTPITQISADGPRAMFSTGGTPYVVRVIVEEAARGTADQG